MCNFDYTILVYVCLWSCMNWILCKCLLMPRAFWTGARFMLWPRAKLSSTSPAWSISEDPVRWEWPLLILSALDNSAGTRALQIESYFKAPWLISFVNLISVAPKLPETIASMYAWTCGRTSWGTPICKPFDKKSKFTWRNFLRASFMYFWPMCWNFARVKVRRSA